MTNNSKRCDHSLKGSFSYLKQQFLGPPETRLEGQTDRPNPDHASQPSSSLEEDEGVLLIGTSWIPKKNGHGLHWRVTDYFTSVCGRKAVQIEKYQGGRNSPAIVTTKHLRKNFKRTNQ